MKYLILSLIVITISIFASCSSKKKQRFFSSKNLATEEFTINTTRDTTLQTTNGALLKIPAGAIISKDGSTAVLEIKEAYSIADMIKGGLVTQSNGEPLSSGGMIYINAASGQELAITKKINVAIPTGYMQDGMKLYKGDTTEDGKVNWVKPDTLPENKQLANIKQGKELFQTYCASCHKVDKDFTGPPLGPFKKNIPYNERSVHYWVNPHPNPDFIVSEYSLRACNLIRKYGSIGTQFPDMPLKDFKAIYDYAESEYTQLVDFTSLDTIFSSCIDSCFEYNRVRMKLEIEKSEAEFIKEGLQENDGGMVIDKNTDSSTITNSLIPNNSTAPDFDQKVSPESFGSSYYQITIETFGWFNIDILIKDIDGVKESELFVRIQGEYTERVQLYLVIPSIRVNTQGGTTGNNKNEYAFSNKDGKILLPQNSKAYIYALYESDGKLAYHLSSFTTSLKQEFAISLVEASREEMKAAFSIFEKDGQTFKVEEIKNAKEILRQDTSLQRIESALQESLGLKPKGCECECDVMNPSTAAPDIAK